MEIEQILDGLQGLHPHVPNYMHLSLMYLRELGTHPKVRGDVHEFIRNTVEFPERAIVVLTPQSVGFLTNEEGSLLEFS